MTTLDSVIAPGFVLFCRIGGCLMTTPGFSSERTPLRVRLYIALGVTVALAPSLIDSVKPAADMDTLQFARLVIIELVVGIFLGMLARLYLLALEMLANAVSMTIGLSSIFAASVHDTEPTPALASFITLCAVTLIFVSDQHLEIIRSIGLSYQTAPVASSPGIDVMLDELTRVLTQSHLLALRISSPFLIFGLVVNLGFGFLSRLTPQVPVYFISGPLIVILGIYAFSVAAPDFFTAFLGEFSAWIAHG